jgi:hypothetical protein
MSSLLAAWPEVAGHPGIGDDDELREIGHAPGACRSCAGEMHQICQPLHSQKKSFALGKKSLRLSATSLRPQANSSRLGSWLLRPPELPSQRALMLLLLRFVSRRPGSAPKRSISSRLRPGSLPVRPGFSLSRLDRIS